MSEIRKKSDLFLYVPVWNDLALDADKGNKSMIPQECIKQHFILIARRHVACCLVIYVLVKDINYLIDLIGKEKVT